MTSTPPPETHSHTHTHACQKLSRPKSWRAVIAGTKQPCWCGLPWHDAHEDASHGPVCVCGACTMSSVRAGLSAL